MPNYDRIKSILGFQQYEVVKVKRFKKQWVELWLEPKERKWRCPGCGQLFLWYYDRKQVMLRDLNLAAHMSFLIVPKYRVRCDRCGVKRVPLSIARSYGRCTRRFERQLFVMTKNTPVSEVAFETGVHWQTIKDAEIRYIVALLRKRDLEGIVELGIDEVSERKGHRYLTLVTDIRGRRVIWVGQGRSKATLRAFFRWFGFNRLRRVLRFIIDMHEPYELAIREHCRGAKIVYDHFHLSKILHRAIDDIRRRIQAELPPEDRRTLKGQRYLLLRAQESLKPKQRVRLRELLRANKSLSAAYILKEDFRAVFDEEFPVVAREELKDWKRRVLESRIPELVKFVKTLNRRRYGIQNFLQHRVTNSLPEGFNNAVKTVKKMAYGFHDSRYFRLKILRRCGKIDERPDYP